MARHYRLVLMALAVLLGAMSLAIAFGSTSTVFYGPEPGLYHFMGRDVSAIVPTGAAILAATLVAGAIYRRGSVRSWLGIGGIGVFVVFFLFAGGFGFTGWKEPTQAPGSLQAEPGR
jgi:hypothetical protein